MSNQERQNLQAFHLLTENIKDFAIFFVDKDERVSYWNLGAQRIFGYTEEEIIGQSFAILFRPEDRLVGVHKRELQRACAEGRAEDEHWYQCKNGSRFFATGILIYFKDNKGENSGFAKILRDTTEKRLGEEMLLRTFNELDIEVKERTQDLEESKNSLLDEASELRIAQRQLKAVLRQLVNSQEEERLRISRDLHDHLGQQVTALRLKAELLKAEVKEQMAICGKVEQLAGMVQKLDEDLAFLTRELRPAHLEQLGLASTLASYIVDWSDNFGIKAEFQTVGCVNQSLPLEVEINLYRIAQEALNNISKHAEAANVAVVLTYHPDRLMLIIEDDGKGFALDDKSLETTEKGFGIIGMKERAALLGGDLEIESVPGTGTTIMVRVPIEVTEIN
jgi:PAS domain S-box-containing protein